MGMFAELIQLPNRVIFGSLLVWGAAGVMCGFAALKPQLLAENVFVESCGKVRREGGCEPQLLRLDRMYQMGIVGATVPCALGGIAIDRAGPRVVGAFMAVLYGAAVFTLGRSTATRDLYMPAFFVLGAAGGIFHMAITLALQRLYPTRVELISNVLTIMWDLSALVPVLFTVAIARWHLSVHTLLSAYGLVMGFFMLSYAVAAIPARGRLEGAVLPAAAKLGSRSLRDLCRTLCSCRVGALCAALSCSCFQGFFFLGTVDEQLRSVYPAAQAASLVGAFALMLPLLSVPNAIVFDVVLTRASISGQWLVVAAVNVLWAMCHLVPVAPLQYATFALYTFWRMFTWVAFFATVGRCFPRDSGAVAGVAQSCTGLLLLLQEPLRVGALRLYPHNFAPLQLGLTLTSAAASCLCARAFWRLTPAEVLDLANGLGGFRSLHPKPDATPRDTWRYGAEGVLSAPPSNDERISERTPLLPAPHETPHLKSASPSSQRLHH